MFWPITRTYAGLTAILTLQMLFLAPGFMKYGIHPDELGYRVMDIIPWSKWKPINYFYPTTHLYTVKLLTVPIADVMYFKLGLINTYDDLLFNRLGRVITGLMAFGCTLLFYQITVTFSSKAAALIAALLAASFPLLANLGRYNTTDVPNAFWMLVTTGYAVHAFHTRLGSRRIFILGMLLGITAGVKYLGVLITPALIAGMWSESHMKNESGKLLLKRLGIFAIGAIVAFLLTTPFSVIDFRNFYSDVLYLKNKVPTWEGTERLTGAIGIPIHIVDTVNPIILGFCCIGIWHSTRNNRNPLYLMLMVTLLTYYAFFARTHFYPQRFLLPIYFIVLMLAWVGMTCMYPFICSHPARAPRLLYISLVCTGLALQIRESAAISYNHYHETRYEAAKWVCNQLDAGKVALPTRVYTYFPVRFIPGEKVFDIALLDGNNTFPTDVKFGMTSSFFSPIGLEKRAELHICTWKRAKQYSMQSFLGLTPKHTEFLCPTIRIYRRPQSE